MWMKRMNPKVKKMKLFFQGVLFGLFVIVLLIPKTLLSQEWGVKPGEEVVRFSAEVSPKIVRIGESFRVVVKMDIRPTWHVYSVLFQGEDAPPPTKLSLVGGDYIFDGPVYESRPVTELDKVIGIRLSYHEQKGYLYQNLKLGEGTKTGLNDLSVKVDFLACNDRLCLPPNVKQLDLKLMVENGPPREELMTADRSIEYVPRVKKQNSLTKLVSKGFWQFVGLAAFMGLISLITPCVFPMIPITVSFFSKQAEGKQSRVLKLALLFTAGIIGTYTGTGLLLSALFGASSALQFATHPLVNLAIAGLFVVFALSLMGFFTLNLPGMFQNYFDEKSRRLGGAAGVLLMGFTFTLTAFTCTVQFVGTMLISASQGMWLWPFIGMVVFSSVFAFPFFLLAIAPGMIKVVQKHSGDWLGRSKIVLGILELIAAVKFLSNADLVWQTNLISRNVAIIIWIILLVCVIVYLTWTNIRPILNRAALSWFVVLIFVCSTVYVGYGYNDRSLGSLIDSVLPPPSGHRLKGGDYITEEQSSKLIWYDNVNDGLVKARKLNRPVMIDFTGYTCVNCRWMEQNVFNLKDVYKLFLEEYVLVRLYTDGGEKASENLQYQIDHFNTVALPLYVILNKDGEFVRQFSGISQNPQEFVDFLTSSE